MTPFEVFGIVLIVVFVMLVVVFGCYDTPRYPPPPPIAPPRRFRP